MLEAMFWAAGELFGLKFERVRDLPVYHPDVEVFEVTRGGERVGLWYFDPYARAGKRSGAWMNEYRTQERLGGVATTPIISNNENFIPPKPGEPCLISWTDAVTLFHEFGHGLHGLNSNVTYPSLAGTAVLRDFVELPSQLFEHWLPTPRAAGDASPCTTRPASRCRPALVDKVLKRRHLPPGLQDGGIPLRRHPRPEGAPVGRRPRSTRPSFERDGADRDRHAAADRAAPPAAALLPHVLRRRAMRPATTTTSGPTR